MAHRVDREQICLPTVCPHGSHEGPHSSPGVGAGMLILLSCVREMDRKLDWILYVPSTGFVLVYG